MAKSSASQLVSVDGHRLKISNLDKVLYPESGTTKADVLGYYAAIAPVMLPHVIFRPATRKRWVHGVGTPDAPGETFFQKDLPAGTPDWVPRAVIPHSDHDNTYPLVNNAAVLAWLAQAAALEIHVPQWRFTAEGARRNPDRIVLDLDPGEGIGLPECAEVARLARTILTGMGLDPLPVTSGSKGIHLYAQLDERQTSDQVSAVARELARALEADHPDLVVSDMKKTLRTGKVLVDWSQNNGNKTTIAPYSLRGRFRPTVAAPRTWEELSSPDLAHLEYGEVLARVTRDGDALAAIDAGVGPVPDAGIRGGRATAAAASGSDRLSEYRAKRDASKTPEPVPDAVGTQADGRSFVIQEHHARRLHYDLRLEHDGVLVSWAVPKGVPADPGRNHLAVQTEDHPLEYGSFEGTIPAGEYGAGTMRIWDSGSYELEKWRDDEVIVTLTGSPSGGLGEPVRLALIRTSTDGTSDAGRTGSTQKSNWLLHRMKSTTPHYSPAARRRYAPVPPAAHQAMLARAGTLSDLGNGPEWAMEMKWDGIRAIASIEGDAVRLMTRNGNDVTAAYPELIALTDVAHVRSGVFDGEIVATDAAGRPDFGLLQERMNLVKPGEIEAARKRRPVRLFLFDVLELDGEDLTGLAYSARRTQLEKVVDAPRGSPIAVPDAFDGDAESAIEFSRNLGLEGIVAKEKDSLYEEGRRSGVWIKIKHLATQEVVIGGWRTGKGHRAGTFGSLLVGLPTPEGLRYIGRVGSGLRDQDLQRVMKQLEPLGQTDSPFIAVPREESRDAHWVAPNLVGEVEFSGWTRTGSLRHPTWRGIRPDKNPDDVSRE
ncbi:MULTISPECIES: ATP-dependent DNA ligase [unclassified Leifsonia]|uniref:ATP-dependent DNA ligase n=1 Tax=unclassified Leifsonia TaxID=2663824 RepID=UPI0006F59E09|nr:MULTISPECIES: ATP-dependent DNA ligase [unclassified Leifsonia]KQX07269.1 ATP-dependent DNA ligase [Leifsonia sp. Root1293]KRA11552.1 ATP-dependent DNA ligase [Leifsonia sp. Root60]